ncbi:hypothetical protein shim_15570 [Shimia sp. SK013]|uniref:hypothetical protein n=1 Tax=Shimia sp. SK013 TaxID=1389006 RepID=UPI0006B4089F|nr:hypothetical protein [Shimia sp. SK013]KPA22110.1 hypothetical protein shim_15570 [Shimia sp. SK013]
MRIHKLILAGAAALGLAACGDTFGEQALIGAGAGTAAAAVVGGNLAAGAVIGGAANAIYCQEFSNKC